MLRTLTCLSACVFANLNVTAETAGEASAFQWTPYDGAEISFDVLRKGKPFGKHIVRFDKKDAGDLTATTDVDLKVKIGPFTAFQYRLDSTEIWRDGRLVSLQGRTNDDGDKSAVTAAFDAGALKVDGTAFQGTVDAPIIPSSHWNINQVRSDRMLSTEDGEILEMNIVPKGREQLQIGGETISANRYLLDSDIDIDLWYDDLGRWVKLTFQARGQEIEYRLSDLY